MTITNAQTALLHSERMAGNLVETLVDITSPDEVTIIDGVMSITAKAREELFKLNLGERPLLVALLTSRTNIEGVGTFNFDRAITFVELSRPEVDPETNKIGEIQPVNIELTVPTGYDSLTLYLMVAHECLADTLRTKCSLPAVTSNEVSPERPFRSFVSINHQLWYVVLGLLPHVGKKKLFMAGHHYAVRIS